MATSIATSIIACLKSFNEFIADIESLLSGDTSELGLFPTAWGDELGRLRIWAANIGAHQTGQSSLDFRLRDSSHIREQILKLLQDLLQRLQDTREVLTEGEEATDNDEATDQMLDDEEPTTEVQELRESVATIINCLFQMSMLVRKPAQHDIVIGSRRAEVVMFEPFDYAHVRDKYPRADNMIIERLGLAVTRRRKYLKYRERHALKLKQGINEVAPERDGETIVEGLSETIATDVKEPNIRFNEGGSDSGVSQTSYAQTLLGGGDITIPKPPKNAQGGSPFECPYCYFIITTKGTNSWTRHVFQDLQPYICIATTCNTPDKLYSTRHEWLHHLKTIHPTEFPPRLERGETAPSFTCLLCREKIQMERQYDRHVARHLQELALFVLPRNDDDSDTSRHDHSTDEGSSPKSDGLDGSFKARYPPEALDICSHILHESLGPDCEKALKEGAFGNQVRYRSLRDNLQDVLSTLQGLDLEDHRDIEDKREIYMKLAESWLDSLDKAVKDALRKPTEDASGETGEPAALDSGENEEQMSLADVEQQTENAYYDAFCKVCKLRFNGDLSTMKDLKCPRCSSTLVTRYDLAGDLNHEDLDDNFQGIEFEPDSLKLEHKGVTHFLRFPAYSVSQNLTIGRVRLQAASAIKCNDPRRIKLLCKGRSLREDSRMCREEGVTAASEITCVVSSESEFSKTGPSESDESRSPSPEPSKTEGNESGKARSPSPVPAEESAPAKRPDTPAEIMQAISNNFNTNILPKVRRLFEHPPKSAKERDYDSKKLSEEILTQVLFKLDGVETEDEEIRGRRKECVKLANFWSGKLDALCRDKS